MDFSAQFHAAFRDLVYIGVACGWFWLVRHIVRGTGGSLAKTVSVVFGLALLVGLASQAEPRDLLRFLVVFSVVGMLAVKRWG